MNENEAEALRLVAVRLREYIDDTPCCEYNGNPPAWSRLEAALEEYEKLSECLKSV